MPRPSAPSTRQRPASRSTSAARCGAAASAPTIHSPASLMSRRQRARLVTVTTGVVSAAPAATLRAAGVEAGGAIARHDHGQRTAGIGGAQAGAEVVRILHAVKGQHQAGRVARREPFEEVVLVHGPQRLDLGHHALVCGLAEPATQALRIDAFDRQVRGPRQLLDLRRALVAPFPAAARSSAPAAANASAAARTVCRPYTRSLAISRRPAPDRPCPPPD